MDLIQAKLIQISKGRFMGNAECGSAQPSLLRYDIEIQISTKRMDSIISKLSYSHFDDT